MQLGNTRITPKEQRLLLLNLDKKGQSEKILMLLKIDPELFKLFQVKLEQKINQLKFKIKISLTLYSRI
jgi:hypothetical protein